MSVSGPKLPVELRQLVSPELEKAITLENVEVVQAVWVGGESKRASFDAVRFIDPDLTSAKLRDGGWADIAIDAGMLAGADFAGSSLRRVRINTVRASGVVFSETEGKDISITDSKLDLANFRFATWSGVLFVRCSFNEADFAGAHLKDVTFSNCDLTGCDFSGAQLSNVDLRSSTLENVKGLAGIKGATINTAQLIGLAAALATELGIKVEDSQAVQHDSNRRREVEARNHRLHRDTDS